MADREITPFGCRHCGVPQSEHGSRYLNGPGMHSWAAPTARQILARMRIRRAYRLESK
ncbi:hypothetical protein ACFV1H_18000 [Streptomyces virginiae]|uniref:hypothetical protein n=1 Tax=Streptomyces virginiae TaxID=1961 RepID=UPI0036AD7F81